MLTSATFPLHLNTSRGGDFATSLGTLLQCMTTLSVKSYSPHIHLKAPLAQPEAISYPFTCYLGRETEPHFTKTSFQADAEADEVLLHIPFLQDEHSQLP